MMIHSPIKETLMRTSLEEYPPPVHLFDKIDFTNPILTSLKNEMMSAISSHHRPKELVSALYHFCHYALNASSASQYNVSVIHALKVHENPMALIKAVMFFAPKGLILVDDNEHAEANFEKINLEATTLFGDAELVVYFNSFKPSVFPQECFNKLMQFKCCPEKKLHSFLIACVLCEMQSTDLENLNQAYETMARFLNDEYYLLTLKTTVLKIPAILQQALYPTALAQSIIKMSNSNLLLLSNHQSASNFSKLIKVAKLWFDDSNLKESFDLFSSKKITQELFDTLIEISQNNFEVQTARLKINQTLSTWNREDIKKTNAPHSPSAPFSTTRLFLTEKHVIHSQGFFLKEEIHQKKQITTSIQAMRLRSKTENEEELSSIPKALRRQSK